MRVKDALCRVSYFGRGKRKDVLAGMYRGRLEVV